MYHFLKLFATISIGLSLTGVITLISYNTRLTSIQENEKRILLDISSRLGNDLHVKLNQKFISIFLGLLEGDITIDDFNHISSPLREITTDSTSVGWIPIVEPSDRDAFTSQYFDITTINDSYTIVKRPIDDVEMWPILFSNPMNEKFTGFDVFSVWGDDIQEMIDTESAILTDLVPLTRVGGIGEFLFDGELAFDDTREPFIFMIFQPVFNLNLRIIGLVMKILFPYGIIEDTLDSLDISNIEDMYLTVSRKRNGDTSLVFDLSMLYKTDYSKNANNHYTTSVDILGNFFMFTMTSNTVPELKYYIFVLCIGIFATFVSCCLYWVQFVESNKNKSLAESYKKSTDLKSSFLAEMSHELRNPLNGILGTTEILSSLEMTTEAYDYVQDVKSCSLMLLSTVSEILDFSKIEAGAVTLDILPIDIDTFIPGILKIMSQSYINATSGVNLCLKLDKKLPACEIMGDKHKLRQVIMNYVSNAFKFTNEGSIEVIVSGTISEKIVGTYVSKNHDKFLMLNIDVKDTGIGMSEEKVSRLFMPFSQVHLDKESVDGTGLGLVITKSICESMGGSASCQSSVGVGSIFKASMIFGLPCKTFPYMGESPMMEWKLLNEKDDNMRTIREESNADINCPVLVVDDVSINRKVVSKMLEIINIPVEIACDGIDAIEMCREKKYSMILMDYYMPGMTGPDATISIRNDVRSKNRSSNIIGLTASSSEDSFKCMLDSGMNTYILKPVTMSVIDKLCREYCETYGDNEREFVAFSTDVN